MTKARRLCAGNAGRVVAARRFERVIRLASGNRFAGAGRPASERRYRCESMNAVNCAFDKAPTFVAASWPSLNSMSVGMPRMPYLAGTSRFSSTFILAMRSLPL